MWTWAALAAAVPAFVDALLWSRRLARRGGQPLLDLELFRARGFALGLAANAAFMGYFISSVFVLSLLLQSGRGLTPPRRASPSYPTRCSARRPRSSAGT